MESQKNKFIINFKYNSIHTVVNFVDWPKKESFPLNYCKTNHCKHDIKRTLDTYSIHLVNNPVFNMKSRR